MSAGLEAFRASHGDPTTWTVEEFDAWLALGDRDRMLLGLRDAKDAATYATMLRAAGTVGGAR
ncbi:hypothetical protein [Streptomyces sp. NPDC093225]|uniref:hypothetical protein n=1 Tax=Streptomyces sp. NPDC093225 TaxID=3366034 RepID=UPI00382D2D7C